MDDADRGKYADFYIDARTLCDHNSDNQKGIGEPEMDGYSGIGPACNGHRLLSCDDRYLQMGVLLEELLMEAKGGGAPRLLIILLAKFNKAV